MKKSIWIITKASLLTLILYIALYFIWGAILSSVENPTVHLLLVGVMTSAGFSLLLVYTSKIRNGIGEDEVMADYKEHPYSSVMDDLKKIFKNEKKLIIGIVIIVFFCFLLNTFDALVFNKKVLSFPTIIFAPLCLLSEVFEITAIGYFLSIAFNIVFYVSFLLIYRKRKYNYWMMNK